jgi:S1-C subfamily serine protease
MDSQHSRLILANWMLMLTVAGLCCVLLWSTRGADLRRPPPSASSAAIPAGRTPPTQGQVGLGSIASDPGATPLAIARREVAEEETATIALFKAASPSVVHITTHSVQRNFFSLNLLKIPQGSGTGFVWDKSGHIVTNYHVIKDADVAFIAFGDQDSSPAKLVGAAPEKDLAVLKIDADPAKLQPLPLGTSGDLQVGLKALAIGNPFGLDHTLTTGIISALGREIESTTGLPIKDVIQTDAAINPGNSGGPLLDSSGRLIGVNTAIYSPSGTYAGIGFAIPVDVVKWVVPELIAHGKVIRPGLAVGLASDRMIAQLGLPGVLILDVKPGSQASLAPLRPTRRTRYGEIVMGDIIIAIDGKPIKDNKELILTLEAYEVGDRVTVSIWREGKQVDLDVVLEVSD